jgi:uncharacterized protein (UPF0261 family)
MVVRTQVTLDSDTHRRAKQRAADRGISFAEYIRQVVEGDLGEEPRSDIDAIVGIGDSGGSNVAREKERYLDEATWSGHLRKVGRRRA